MRSSILPFCLGLISFLAFSLSSHAQCDGRYKNVQFDSVAITSNIQYGQSVNLNGDSVDLLMDVYEPVGDTLLERPLIIFAHGGSFVSGSKNNSTIEEISTKMAKRGFVTASINYRLTSAANLIDSVMMVQETIMAAQDGKAAVRYFRKDADLNGNRFGVDTNQIFMGGNSAGAILSLHMAFVDDNEFSAINSQIQSIIDQLGGIEGNSGNPGYSSHVSAVINMSGALKNASIVDANDPSLVSLHGTIDETVPYGRGPVLQNQPFTLIIVEGSSLVHDRANSVGITNRLKTFYGAGHSPFVDDTAYMDTTINIISSFMQKRVDCYQPTGILALSRDKSSLLNVYPNPSVSQVTVDLQSEQTKQSATLQLFNNQGQLVHEKELPNSRTKTTLERGNLPAGLYHIVVHQRESNQILRRKIMFR